MRFRSLSAVAFIGVAATVFGVGCGGEEATKAYEALAEKGCACKDSKCIGDVSKERADWATKNKDTSGSEEQAKRIAAALTKFGECTTKITMAEVSKGVDAAMSAMPK
jgi:hypothetical protein